MDANDPPNEILYLWTDGGKRGLYTLSLPPSGGVVSATWLGSDVPTFTGLAIRAGGAGDLLGSSTIPNDRIEQLSRLNGSVVNSYEMYLGVNPYDYAWGDMTLGELAVEEEPSIEVEKDYRYTNVCFERDNDLDGLFNEDPVEEEIDNDVDGWFSEDPVNGIDDDLDGLFDEDPSEQIDNDSDGLFGEDDIDCPLGSYLGDLLPMDNGNYVLEAVIKKNGKVTSYNPGQYYAVSTVTVLDDVDTLTIVEDWGYCDEISTLNPKKGGGRVVIVQVGGEINGLPVPDPLAAYQILDATMVGVTFPTATSAKAVLQNVKAGTTILMYVKFGPGLKGETWEPENSHYGPCINYNSASTAEVPVDIPQDWATAGEDWIVDSANLIVVDEY